ncbi:MAG: T9SS type A sorting domain-containing protein [Bacteroidetes bacterium]|nr:T9SS type A sorting domain-containing protein [Bacteroidota bacterium]
MKKLYLFLSLFIIVSTSKADWVHLTSFPSSNAEDILEKNGVLYAGASGSGVYVSYNNGANWVQRNNGLTTTRATTIQSMAYLSTGLFIATTDGIFKSTDEGLNWTAKNNGIQIGPGAIYYFAYSVFEDAGALYAGTFNAIYKSTNDGDNWTPVTAIIDHNDFCAFNKYNNMILAGTSGNHTPVIYSTNAGANWVNMQLNGGFPTGAFCIYSEPGKIYVGTALGMYYSTNNGANFVNRSVGLGPDPYVFSIIKYGNVLFSGTNAWVYKSTNEGLTWDTVTFSGQTFQDVNKVLISNNRLYAAAYTGLWYRNLSEIITGVENPSGGIPVEYKLLQNYPNPFNPVTKIEYQIPRESHVMIRVYDFTGKEVQTLVNESKISGSYAVEFNASQLSSGVYFYKLEAAGFSSTKKMTMIK